MNKLLSITIKDINFTNLYHYSSRYGYVNVKRKAA